MKDIGGLRRGKVQVNKPLIARGHEAAYACPPSQTPGQLIPLLWMDSSPGVLTH